MNKLTSRVTEKPYYTVIDRTFRWQVVMDLFECAGFSITR